MVDPDVNGVQGLLSLQVVISIVIYAMLLYSLMIMIQIVFLAMGKYYGSLSILLLAILSALGLVLLMGSFGFLGTLLIFSLTYLFGAFIPAHFLARKVKLKGS